MLLFWRPFPVYSRSRRRLRDVSISCGDVAETNFIRDWGDVNATSPRPAGDQGHSGDVAVTSPRRCLTHFRDQVTERVLASSRRLHSSGWSRTSPWRRLGESASHFLVSRVARVAATDQSRQSRRRLRL